MLHKELGIFTFRDLLDHFPLRHVDKTKIAAISDINYKTEYIQVAGIITSVELIGEKSAKRMVAYIADNSGELELTWFQGINWVQKILQKGSRYLVYGKIGFFNSRPQITHPEIELYSDELAEGRLFLDPIYPTTEKLKARSLNARQIGKLTGTLLAQITEKDIPENLPEKVITQLKFVSRYKAFGQIHFPKSEAAFSEALTRLKFEEFFLAQLRMSMIKTGRHRHSKGILFEKVGDLFNTFYNKYLPFQLTGAQKKVLKEIRTDTARGHQMNRLLQGDVGSGKTIVALLSMLLAADNGFQSCMMAPTEILAQQHYNSLSALLKDLPVKIALLTGSVKTKKRKEILEGLLDGTIHFLVGTHAIIEEVVQFKNIGLAIADEQHRFGVEQRAKLWKKASIPPHVLVMTATPIPRTLALTFYGDLDYSIMDELPPGRKPIATVHRFENKRASVMDFIRTEISNGRQAYIIYPLIEESEKMSYEDLMQGYEQVKSFFPEPQYSISMLHGRMKPALKEENMKRFLKGETQIMVSTTIIEVGVDVPNASVMVIESAEKFGLSQLHQLRGRVGRGTEKSFCILLTSVKLSTEAKERLKTMTSTNDGFKIAEKDLELRGPGDIEGTRQSGMLNFKLVSLVNDKGILDLAKYYADIIIEDDELLNKSENLPLKNYLYSLKGKTVWSRIS